MKSFLSRLDIPRLIKFSVVGGVGLIVNTVALFLLTNYVFGERLYLVAAAISLEISILNNFFLNEYWTFRDRAGPGGIQGRLAKFHGSRIAGTITTLAVLYLLTDFLGIFYLVSNIVGVLAGMAVNYLTSSCWVWR
ncbi:MAG: GtrA family protein [Candidatus Caldarchaeum sp.]